MLDTIYEVIFVVGLAVYLFGVYRPSVRQYKKRNIKRVHTRKIDIGLDFLTYAGWQILPLIYVFTPWLDFADYYLPSWCSWLGCGVFGLAIAILYKSYSDLGSNWSPKLDILKEHSLVTDGIYCYIRHPIYAGLWLWGIAHPLLLHNWIAGLSLIVIFTPLYLVRVPQEEKMMLEHFGEKYRSYMEKTGRIIPQFSAIFHTRN